VNDLAAEHAECDAALLELQADWQTERASAEQLRHDLGKMTSANEVNYNTAKRRGEQLTAWRALADDLAAALVATLNGDIGPDIADQVLARYRQTRQR
jgi:hypothetical protein